MAILEFLIRLAGAVMLLLYAVRMVRTGVERALGPRFRHVVTRTQNPFSTAATGTALAILLQSSAAVGLLAAGFAASGALQFGPGLAMVFGADFGSALLIKLLSFHIEWLTPFLLAAGGFLFLKTESRSLRQIGRIVMGVALIMVALGLLRSAVEPIRESAFLPAVAGYLERDYVTAFLAGAVLAFILHSSVAMILMCVAIVSIGALPVGTGVSLVLGANVGSALIPVWLSRSMAPEARRIPIANLTVRGLYAIAALVAVNRFPLVGMLPPMAPAQTVVAVHIIFNAGLLVLVPFSRFLERPFRAAVPDAVIAGAQQSIEAKTVLDPGVLGTPNLALACVRREVMRMARIVEDMMTPTMDLYSRFDRAFMREIRDKDKIVDAAFDGIRHYAARMPNDKMGKDHAKQLRELMEYAIALEAAGDIVVRHLLPLAEEKADKRIRFSPEGEGELATLHKRALSNLALASNVLVSNDVESARLLLGEKDEMRNLHRASRKKHLQRISEGEPLSMESSDIHLETASAIKEFNSQITAVAYPILFREGQLLETRLIKTMSPDHGENGT